MYGGIHTHNIRVGSLGAVLNLSLIHIFYNAGAEAAKLDPEAHYVPGWLQTPQTAPYPSWWPDHLKKN